jgi:hypothetical protein
MKKSVGNSQGFYQKKKTREENKLIEYSEINHTRRRF